MSDDEIAHDESRQYELDPGPLPENPKLEDITLLQFDEATRLQGHLQSVYCRKMVMVSLFLIQ